MSLFSKLSLELQKALEDAGYKEPTPIQRDAIPLALEGYDILGQAATGTGKTGAFAIPIVEKLQKGKPGVKALVLTPTRELAIQVKEQIYMLTKYKRLSSYVFYGGTSVKQNLDILQNKNVDILIGTPGRIKDLINRKALNLSNVEYLVLDEFDQMLDMGFIEDIEYIISFLPKERTTYMFSATVPNHIELLAKRFLKSDFKFVKVPSVELKPNIEEKMIKLSSPGEKIHELMHIIDTHPVEKMLIFVKTKKDAKDLFFLLTKKGIRAQALHGDLTQRQREKALSAFKSGAVSILVATDVAARGLDIKDVGVVINYNIPEDPELYIHRIGRTGRIGKSGKAFSLICPEDFKALLRIKKLRSKISV